MVFQVYVDKRNEYRWRIVARNGQIIGTSGEGYKQKASCVSGIESIVRGVRGTEVTVRYMSIQDPKTVTHEEVLRV